MKKIIEFLKKCTEKEREEILSELLRIDSEESRKFYENQLKSFSKEGIEELQDISHKFQAEMMKCSDEKAIAFLSKFFMISIEEGNELLFLISNVNLFKVKP